MNRRGFLSAILRAGVAAAVLPSAATYVRTWKKSASGIFTADISGCGLLTSCNVVHLTPAQLKKLFAPALKEMNEEADGFLLHTIEWKNAQITRPSFYDFIMQPRTIPEKLEHFTEKLIDV